MKPDYNFYISVNPRFGSDVFTNGSDNVLWGGAEYQVYPGMDRGTSLPYEIEKHRHRRMFNGDLWFVNRTQDDYTVMSQINSTSAEVKIRIEQVTGASDFWEGYFSINDGKWDSDRGIFAVTPAPDDTYRSLEVFGDKEYNMVGVSGGLAAKINYDYETITLCESCLDCRPYGNCTYDEAAAHALVFQADNPDFPVTETGDPTDLWGKYAFCGEEVTDCAGDPCNEYEWSLVWWKQLTPIALNDTYVYDEDNDNYYSPSCDVPTGVLTFNARAFTLTDAIEYIVNEISGLSYVSTFFKNATNPVLDEFYPGVFATNPLNYILIYQKSDIKSTTDPATRAMMTFNDLMLFIENTFNAFWFIDDNGDFRIEHESYFNRTVDFDLTQFESGYWIANMNKWTYDRDKMPSREHFEWMEVSDADFAGVDIVYEKLAVGNKVKDSQLNRVLPITTDITYAYSHQSDISNDGWIFLCTGSDYIVNSEAGTLSSDTLFNGHLAWSNLHKHYWKHGRVLDIGTMNNNNTAFSDVQRNIKQIEITYPTYSSDFNPDGLKTTELGDGEVGEAEYLLLDGTIRTVFFYPNVLSPIAPPAESFLVKTSDIWYVLKDIDKVKWHG